MEKTVWIRQTPKGQENGGLAPWLEEGGSDPFYRIHEPRKGTYVLLDKAGSEVHRSDRILDLMDSVCKRESPRYLLRFKGPAQYEPAPGLLRRMVGLARESGKEYVTLDANRFFLYDLVVEAFQASFLERLRPLGRPFLPNDRLNHLQAGIPARYLEPAAKEMKFYLIDRFSTYFPKPRAVALDIVMACNLRCTKCCFHAEAGPKWSQRRKADEQVFMTKERFHKVVDPILDFRKDILFVFSNAGEPTLHPELLYFVSHIKKRGGMVHITTNATRLSERLGKELIDLDVDHFMISFGATTKDTYEATHVGGDFESTKKNIELLLRNIEKRGMEDRIRVNMHFVVEGANEHETHDYVSYWIDRAPIVTVHQLNDLFSEYAKFDKKGPVPPKRFPCQVLWTSFNVHNNGDLVYCCCWNRDNDQGNIFREEITDFWTGEGIEKARKAHVAGDYEFNEQCAVCEAWMAMPRERQINERYFLQDDPIQQTYVRLKDGLS